MTSCDVNFVNISHLVMQLPGVDPNDPSVRDVLASLEAEEEVTFAVLSLTSFLLFITFVTFL